MTSTPCLSNLDEVVPEPGGGRHEDDSEQGGHVQLDVLQDTTGNRVIGFIIWYQVATC